MKKLMQALSLIALLYCLFLLFDPSHSKEQAVALPETMASSDTASPAPAVEPVPKTKIARLPKSRLRQAKSLPSEPEAALASEESPAVEKFVEKFNAPQALAPLPKKRGWEAQALRSDTKPCAADRDCTPRGRDGVLMLGSSFASHHPTAQWQGAWNLGSANQQTPLMYLK